MIWLIVAACMTGGIAGFFWLLGRPNGDLQKTKIKIGSAVLRVELARSLIERARGLSGYEDLSEDGMLFLFRGRPRRYGFWMRGMKFPIDFVWIREKKVVGVTENVFPEPGLFRFRRVYYPPETVNRVLEMRAGGAARYGIQAGDMVSEV